MTSKQSEGKSIKKPQTAKMEFFYQFEKKNGTFPNNSLAHLTVIDKEKKKNLA
jgi:hypothetical protein